MFHLRAKAHIVTIIVLILTTLSIPCHARDRGQERAALEVIERLLSLDTTHRIRVAVEVTDNKSEKPWFKYRLHHGRLHITASDGVAACRGFYDWMRATESGLDSWSARRCRLPDHLGDTVVEKHSPVAHHQYMNVVTYGYSCPFWDEARWDQEIDWMALHGVDMPLMLVGAEGVYREVMKEMGLSDEELDEWEVGPAHLPWFRMGNLSGNSFDGPLGKDWHQRQEQLCRHILGRMRALGMEPVCPAFGGFVPRAFAERVGAQADTTGWDWMPKDYRNYRLNPSSATFVEVGRRFIRRWEEKYGRGKYYISDSFNEMEIPDDLEQLTRFGDSVFRSIAAENDEAVWVTQGWTFVWQYGQWGNERFKALTRNIPDNRMLVLYMSPEYDPARYYGKGGDPCYRLYEGFAGKQWAYTLLPNMGGKNFYTGEMQRYAWDFAKEIEDYGKTASNLTAYGITAEGVENNEMLYELITDVGWGLTTHEVEDWMRHYARCRYGSCPKAWAELLHSLRTTLYGHYIDHPRFGWQNGAVLTGTGTAVADSAFYLSVERLMAQVATLKEFPSPALEYDLAELVAMYLGGRVDQYSERISNLLEEIKNNTDSTQKNLLANQAQRVIEEVDYCLRVLDSVISIHPQNLRRWESAAQQMAQSEMERRRNAVNARRIVTIWYGNHKWNEPVQDYASKIWSGLVRDYYRPRVVGAWRNKLAEATGHPEKMNFVQIDFENRFVESAPTLTAEPLLPQDKITFMAQAVKNCKHTEDIR